MITISWHLLVLIIAEIIGLVWVITKDDTTGFLGSDRDWAGVLYIILSIVVVSIYGGIYWW